MRRVSALLVLTLLLFSLFGFSLNIQPVKGAETIYINADGSIIPITANITSIDNRTYTLTDDIFYSGNTTAIIIEKDDIVFDGMGHVLQGDGSHYSIGIKLFTRTNVTIRNVEIRALDTAISLSDSSNITIHHCEIRENGWHGVLLRNSTNNIISTNWFFFNPRGIQLISSSSNLISENIMEFNHWCIYLQASSNNVINRNAMTRSQNYQFRLSGSPGNQIFENNVTEHYRYGAYLQNSSSNKFRNNTFTSGGWHFWVSGSALPHFVNDIDQSNTVENKPVYYWTNKQNETVPEDAGFVALVNCTNIMVQNLSITENGQALLLAGTRNSTIIRNTFAGNIYGIDLWLSSHNLISENNITNNEVGIEASNSSNNRISNNRLADNYDYDIEAFYSSNNLISKNDIQSENDGLQFYHSMNNTLYKNNLTGSHVSWDAGIILLYNSSNTNIYGNNITSYGWVGILLDYTFHNRIVGNMIGNNGHGIWMGITASNEIFHNCFINNTIQAKFGMAVLSDVNLWDNDYPSGGNYWDNYNGTDFLNGSSQNESGTDGIGDTPYIIDENNLDRYPLTVPFGQLVWDVNGDSYVGIDDIISAAEHFGQDPTHLDWDSRCDINRDQYVGIDDIVSVAEHFGESI
ncbi:MAG: right-handed parallel beta-helix repeat-containing protein [Candidatus Bathyarchaeota archaeon]|nr:MAG: right-handed parallel beta-helix repeat-containing protein [Candidatus Bathyarchaeota archaeon]